MTPREVERALKARGAKSDRQRGSHKHFRSACGKCATTVPMHAGDVSPGTLRSIQRHMEPCYGKGWLLG